ncbi:MAG: ABC transporter ATP-binding protein [Candidatus Eisenbacteria bacterium]|nr:ABC transporter ATP-binding protein [Candidatus Eisenbacteria bacterium]
MENGSRPIALEVSGVSKRFRKARLARNYTTLKSLFVRRKGAAPAHFFHQALEEISFRVPAGETWGIIGPNGSGKSTLLKLITGIYRPDAGRIAVRGTIASLIELGAGFHPDFTGRENVFLNGIVLGMSKKEVLARFDDIVAFSEIGDFIEEPVRTYSTGMYMRLAFSIAVHVDPDVLLLDEILSVGDEAFQRKSRERIRSFQSRGKTILMVSHDLAAVEEFCSRALLFMGGKIACEGAPADVIARYREGVEEKAAG